MEQYEDLQIEVIIFEKEDIIKTSGGDENEGETDF